MIIVEVKDTKAAVIRNRATGLFEVVDIHSGKVIWRQKSFAEDLQDLIERDLRNERPQSRL